VAGIRRQKLHNEVLRVFQNESSFLDDAPIGARLRLDSEGVPDEYEACRDADVFDWDEARLKAVESYREKSCPLIKEAIYRNYTEDVETKKILVKARQVQEDLIRIDKKAASLLRDVSLREVRRAVSAKRSYKERTGRWWAITGILLFLVPMFAATLVSLWVSSHREWWLLLLGLVEFVIFFVAFYVLLVSSKRWLKSVFAIVLAWCAVAAFIVGFHYRNHNPGLVLEFSAGIAVSGLMFFLSVLLLPWITSPLEFRGQGTTPEALLLIDMLFLITFAVEWEHADEKQQQLMHKLEEAAALAERAFPYAARRSGKRLRKWGIDRGRRIAAVIRKHQERALEVSAEQRGFITASLINGLIFLIRRDWGSLLVVEPEGVKSVVRRYAPRLTLAALLVVLAFLLPYLLPHVIKDSLSFEVTLLITAGFTLISPDAQKAVDTIRSFTR
jgi:hypothetical protein